MQKKDLMTSTWLPLFALCLPVFILGFDPIAVSLLLNPLSAHFSLPLSEIQWLLGGYLLAGAACFWLARSLTRLMDKRWCLLVGLAVFGFCGLLMAWTTVFSIFLIARVLQGMAAAFILMSALGYLDEHDTVTRFMLHLWIIFAVVGISIGSFVSDVLVSAFGWHSIFVLEFIVMLIAAISVFAVLSGPLPEKCILHERIMSQHEYAMASIVGVIAYLLMFAWLVLFGVFLQAVYGLNHWQAGKAYLPFTLIFGLSFFPLRRVTGRYGFSFCLLIGTACTVCSWLLLYFFAMDISSLKLVVAFVLFGIGMSALFYIAHNRYGVSLLNVPSARANRLTMLWLAGFVAVYVLTNVYTAMSSREVQVLNFFFQGLDIIWDYALQTCAVVLAIVSLLLLYPAYVLWHDEHNR